MENTQSLNESIWVVQVIAEMMMNADSSREFTLSAGVANKIGYALFDAQKNIKDSMSKD